MGTTIIPQGTALPLALLLTDGDPSKYPRVELYTPTGTSLGVVDLIHRNHGLYTPSGTTVMTTDAYVVGVYITYDDAGHTVESAAHLRSSEIYVQARYVELTDVVDGAVTVQTALARANAMASGKIVKSGGNQYAYRNSTDSANLFVLEDNDSERTPL
jgi:hypothetical protein